MAHGHVADKKAGPASETKASSSSRAKTPEASGASALYGQESDKLRWLQSNVGNKATLQMLAQSKANAPIQRTPTPGPIGIGGMRSTVNAAKAGGTFGQAEAYKAEGTAADNAGSTMEISGTGVGGQSDTLSSASDKLKDEISKGTENGTDVSAQKSAKAKIDRENQKLGVASGLLDAGSGIVGLINMKKAIAESNSKAKTAGALYEGLESTQKTFAGVAKVVDNAAKLDGNEKGTGASEAVSGYAGSVGDALAAIKSAFFMVKDVYTLFKEGFSEEGIEKDEIVKGGLSAIQNGLEAAQSAVKTVKAILEILEAGIGNLKEVIPGLGIAISGVKITIKVYDMMQWHASRKKMTTIKRDFKAKYASKASGMVKKNSITLFGKTLHESQGTDKGKIVARRKELTDILADPAADQKAKEEAQSELDDIDSYELAKEMKSINSKRMTRAGMEAGLEMVSIAGDIATLSGAGSAVGIGLKAAASGTKAGMSLFRRVKQYGRDKAAEAEKAGNKDSAWGAVFNAEKSSDKKHEKRAKDADLILDMVAKLPEKDDTDAAKKQYQRVLDFIEATGCSTKALFRLNGDVGKQRELLMESMKSRD